MNCGARLARRRRKPHFVICRFSLFLSASFVTRRKVSGTICRSFGCFAQMVPDTFFRQNPSDGNQCHDRNGETGLAVQAARLSVPIQRDLRRPEWILGLWPPGRRTETQHQGRLVARHGHGTRRFRGSAGGSRILRNDGPGLHDHHAPASLEMLGALRPVS